MAANSREADLGCVRCFGLVLECEAESNIWKSEETLQNRARAVYVFVVLPRGLRAPPGFMLFKLMHGPRGANDV